MFATWENGKATERTVAALKERNTARATLRNAGVDWTAAAKAPAAPAKAAAPKPATAPVTTAKAPQRPQTVTEARAEMRQAIAASQGKTIAPAKATAPAPQPAIASTPAKTTSTKASDVWGSAIARMGKPAALSASKASMAPWDKVIDRMKAAR